MIPFSSARATRLAAGALAAALAATPLAAQSSADTTRLDPVVVTATRTSVVRSQAPAAVTVLTGEELRAQGVVRVSDALRQVPGAALAHNGSFGAVTSLFLRGGESDYVKVLVDGVPVNEAGGGYDFASLTTDNVDRIEILRGPGSVVYGSDAVTGVVQIFTRRGAGRPRGSVAVRAGSYATREGSVDGAGAAGALGYSLGAATRRTDGVLPLNNDSRNDALSAQLRYAPSRAADLQLSTRYTEGTFHFPTDYLGVASDSNQFTRERRLTTGLDAGYRLVPGLEARLLLADTRSSRLSDNAPDSPGDSADFYSRDDAARYRRSADARLGATLPAGMVATIGGMYEAQHESNRGSSRFGTFPTELTTFDARRIDRALYTQLLARLRDLATLTVGGRYDDNDRFGIFRTGRAAVAIRLPFGVDARAAAGNAFKEPAFTEVFNTAFTTGNPALRPERTRTYEGGLERAFARGAFTLGATYFSQRFDDMVQYRPIPVDIDYPSVPNYFNVAAAKAAGVETELRTRSFGGLSGRAQYTYLETRVLNAGFGASGTFVAGQPLLRRPTRSASGTLQYARRGGTALSATVDHVGSRSDRDFVSVPNRDVRLPAYTTLDLAGAATLPLPARSPSVALTARVENAFGKRYQSIYGYDAPRTVVLVGGRVGVQD